MNNNRISYRQGILLIAMYIIGSSSLFFSGIEAKKDIWLAIIFAIIFAALISLIYARLISTLPEKDFFEIVEYFLGKVFSKFFFFLLSCFSFILCGVVLKSFSLYVKTLGLPLMPSLITMFVLALMGIWTVWLGIETIARWNEIYVFYIMAFSILTFIASYKFVNIDNLLPFFDKGIIPVLKGSFGVLTVPFAEIMVFVLVFPSFKKGVVVNRVFLLGLGIGSVFILIAYTLNVLVLGTNIIEKIYYPMYSQLSILHYGEFVQRVEIYSSAIFVIAIFLKVCILLLGTCKGIARVIGFKNYKSLVIPIGLILLIFSYFSFGSIIYFNEWVKKILPYFAAVFEIIIPSILLIIIEIRLRTKNNRVLKK